LKLYEDEYIAVWEALVTDFGLPNPSNAAATADLMRRLGGRTSPWRGLLKAVDDNTYLATPSQPAQPGKSPAGVLDSAGQAAKDAVGADPPTTSVPTVLSC